MEYSRRAIYRVNSRKIIAYVSKRRMIFKGKIAKIKLEIGCIDCGFRGHPEALEFDHKPGFEKCFKVTKGHLRPWPEVVSEMAKCDVRCANCHRIQTATRREEKMTRRWREQDEDRPLFRQIASGSDGEQRR